MKRERLDMNSESSCVRHPSTTHDPLVAKSAVCMATHANSDFAS